MENHVDEVTARSQTEPQSVTGAVWRPAQSRHQCASGPGSIQFTVPLPRDSDKGPAS